jgi:hypothetical protein
METLKEMKTDLIAMLIIFALVLLAKCSFAQDSLSWVCQSGIGITIEDQEYLSGHLVAGFVTLRNVHADSFKITVRDSVSLIDCDLGEFEIQIYDCSEFESLQAINWIDSAIALIDTMTILTNALDQDSCYISGQAALHAQIIDIGFYLDDLIEARDNIEASATGRNLELFNFYKPYVQADISQIEDYIMRYVALLYSDTCERVENRLHGRIDFIQSSLFRLQQNFESLKNGWI